MMKFSFNQYSKNSGFTLLEMLIVAFIIIILSVIVVVNYEFGGYKHNLTRSAHRLAQDIRKAQEMAMSARELEGGGGVPPGYGIYLSHTGYPDTYYVLFADKDGNGEYDQAGGEAVEGPLYFEEGVNIFHTCFSGAGTCPSDPSIAFYPPAPIIKFDNQDPLNADVGSILITLYSAKIGEEIVVSVNPVGLVEVQ